MSKEVVGNTTEIRHYKQNKRVSLNVDGNASLAKLSIIRIVCHACTARQIEKHL